MYGTDTARESIARGEGGQRETRTERGEQEQCADGADGAFVAPDDACAPAHDRVAQDHLQLREYKIA